MICRSSISLADHSWSIVSDQYGLHLVFLKVTTFSGKYTSLEPFSDRKTHSTYPSKHIYIFSKSQLNKLMISNLAIKIRTYNSWYHDKSHDESNIILSNRIWSYSNCSIWTLEQCIPWFCCLFLLLQVQNPVRWLAIGTVFLCFARHLRSDL